MVEIKAFIEENENQLVIIDACVPGDCFTEEVYKGMLHDIPIQLYSVLSYENGWSIGNQCPVITVHPDELKGIDL